MSLLLHEGELRVEAILKHHSLFRVLIAAVGTLVLGAWLVLLFEENAKGAQHPQLPRRPLVGHRHGDHRGLRGPVSRSPREAGSSRLS